MIDLRADDRRGLLGFRPTAADYLELTGQTLREGLKLLLKHPRLLGLFMEAVRDNWRDQFHARGARPASEPLNGTQNGYACGRAA
jgi:hypothetical protein